MPDLYTFFIFNRSWVAVLHKGCSRSISSDRMGIFISLPLSQPWARLSCVNLMNINYFHPFPLQGRSRGSCSVRPGGLLCAWLFESFLNVFEMVVLFLLMCRTLDVLGIVPLCVSCVLQILCHKLFLICWSCYRPVPVQISVLFCKGALAACRHFPSFVFHLQLWEFSHVPT